MFAGHAACGLFLHRAFPFAPLWLLVLAASFADFLFTALALMGAETFTMLDTSSDGTPRLGFHRLRLTHAPYSHGLVCNLVASCVGAAVVSAVYTLGGGTRGHTAKDAVVQQMLGVAIAIPSHWVMDFIVHDGDMAIAWNGPNDVGLGLWAYKAGAVATALEITMVLAAYALLRDVPSVRAGGVNMERVARTLVILQLVAHAAVLFPPEAGSAADSQAVQLLATAAGYVVMLWACMPRASAAGARREAP